MTKKKHILDIIADTRFIHILLSIVLIFFRSTRRYGTAMLLGLAIGALITNICVKPLIARPRPYTWDGSVYQKFWIELGKHTESDKSFPSGHMTAAMAADANRRMMLFICKMLFIVQECVEAGRS